MHSANNSNIFLAYYNHIDKYLTYILGLKRYMPYTEKVEVLVRGDYPISTFVAHYHEKLRFFGEMRNQLVHGFRLENKHYVLASDFAVEQIKLIYEELRQPTTVFEIFGKPVFTCKLTDDLKTVVDAMRSGLNSHVPVYDEKNNFVEMLSESTIAYWIADQLQINDTVQLEDIKIEDIPLKNSNDFFIFVDKEKSIYDIEHLFAENFKQHKRLGAVFVTEHGRAEEQIEGILTAMDLPELTEHFVL